MGMVFCRGCGKEIHEAAPTCPHCGAPQDIKNTTSNTIPDGIRGWSWGAFLLNWIWAIFNKTWIGLLTLVPFVGLIMAVVLGFKGREWAWENNRWDSVEHFNRVQKKWSFWAVIILLVPLVIGILAAIAIPAYQGYQHRAQEVAEAKQAETEHVAKLEAQHQAEIQAQQNVSQAIVNHDYAGVYNLSNTNACQLSIKITNVDNEYAYEATRKTGTYKGKLLISQSKDGETYFTFDNLIAAEPKSNIDGLFTGNAIKIQNSGNAMNQYMKFEECADGEKILELSKARAESQAQQQAQAWSPEYMQAKLNACDGLMNEGSQAVDRCKCVMGKASTTIPEQRMKAFSSDTEVQDAWNKIKTTC